MKTDKSQEGVLENRLTNREIRQTALFNEFVDDEELGWQLLIATICESVGLILSPVILLRDAVGVIWSDYLLASGLRYAETCVNTTEFNYGLLNQSNEQCVQSSSSNECITTKSNLCPEIVYKVSKVIVESYANQSSEAFKMLQYLEDNAQSQLVDSVIRFFSPLIWAFTIVERAPYIYYDYYFGNKYYTKLPTTRNMCLLNSGLAAIKVELQKLHDKMDAEMHTRAKDTQRSNQIIDNYYEKRNKRKPRSSLSRIAHSAYTSVMEVLDEGLEWMGISAGLSRVLQEETGVEDTKANSFVNDIDSYLNKVVLGLYQVGIKVWNNFISDLNYWFRRYGTLDWLKIEDARDSFVKFNMHVNDKSASIKYNMEEELSWEIVLGAVSTSGCITNKLQTYNYELCYFNTIKQNNVLLGTFERWEWISDYDLEMKLISSNSDKNSAALSMLAMLKYNKTNSANSTAAAAGTNKHKFNYQVYGNGDECYIQGKKVPRKAYVYYYCNVNKQGEIFAVRELEVCTYHVFVYNAYVCMPDMEVQAKGLLDELGVFGFSKK